MSVMERTEKLVELEALQGGGVAEAAAIARVTELLDDPDEEVRAGAIEAAGSFPTAPELLERALELARGDGASVVRQGALTALGRVVQEGDLAGAEAEDYAPEAELGEPTAALYSEVKAFLLEVEADEDRALGERRAALESLACLSHEERVVQGIEALFAEGDPDVRRAALRCAARSGEAGRWGERILESLDDDRPEVRAEAVRAAAAAELVAARARLAGLLADDSEAWVRAAAAGALGRLGGDGAGPALLSAAQDDHEDEVQEAARNALEELGLLEEPREGTS